MIKKTILFILLTFCFLLNAAVLYILNSGSETLSRIDLETGNVNNAFAALGYMPNRFVCNTQYIYVANSGDNSIQKIESSTGATLTNIFLGLNVNPYDLILTEDYLFVSGGFSNQIYKIELATDTVIDQVTAGNNPAGMAISGNKLYVGNTDYMTNYNNCSVSVIDLEAYEVIATIPTATNPQYLLADGDQVHVSCTGDWSDVMGTIQIISISTDTIVHTIEMGGYCGDLTITPEGIVYIGDAMNAGVYAYNAADWTVLYSPAEPFLPGGSVIEADNTNLAVLGGEWGQNFTVNLYELNETHISDFQVGLYAIDMKFQLQQSSTDENYVTEAHEVTTYPNPFYNTVTFRTTDSRSQIETIKIYDIRGRLVKNITSPMLPVWDGKDNSGLPVPSGIYLSIVKTAANSSTAIRLIKMK
ncbi:MAG: T9SS type A sorting domain-containing protein [Candidatus Cloacimonetes bacterium]|nr:T9SS type A sorting domain-containing protein [Candidatus Cloacimonadota bacterium]